MALFTERPLILLLLLSGALLISFVFWVRTENRRWANTCWLVLAASPLLLAVSILVVTRREQLQDRCRTLARAVDEGDMAELASHLAVDFEAAGLTRAEFLAQVERTLSHVRIDHPQLSRLEITFPREDTATAEFGVSCTARSGDFGAVSVPSRWRLTFRLSDGHWLVTRVESIPVPPLHFSSLRQWLR